MAEQAEAGGRELVRVSHAAIDTAQNFGAAGLTSTGVGSKSSIGLSNAFMHQTCEGTPAGPEPLGQGPSPLWRAFVERRRRARRIRQAE
ncbi:hypothetical protein [Streptomyces sp. NPDC093589]|uniref:hypothetical protein n=1 Tax=Streptomyces sp. NPDC093589 TaxID=3366043 RepID=UPI00382191AD